MEDSVAAIRNAVRYVRSSSARLDAFKACVEKVKLECKKVCILDVPTRWNSTYLMLDTSLELRKAFDRLAEQENVEYFGYFDEEEVEEHDEDFMETEAAKTRLPKKRAGPPTHIDWEKAEVFVTFLKIFYEVTLRVSTELLKPSNHKAFHDIVGNKAKLDDLYEKPFSPRSTEADLVLYERVKLMKLKYKKYFGELEDANQFLLVALVLDPRYKLKYFSHICLTTLKMEYADVKKQTERVKELVIRLCDVYAAQNGDGVKKRSRSCLSQDEDDANREKKSIRVGNGGKMASMFSDWKKHLKEDEEVVVSHDFERYLVDPIEEQGNDEEEYDILNWWKQNGSKYPNLQAVAKDVLAIQVLSVASESSFSTGKRIIDPYRSSLTPKSVEALICYQIWLKADSIIGLQYTPTIDEAELIEAIEK